MPGVFAMTCDTLALHMAVIDGYILIPLDGRMTSAAAIV